MSERSLLIDIQPALDGPIARELSKISGVASEIYTLFTPTPEQRAEEMRKFHESGGTYNPNFQPRQVDEGAAVKREQGLLDLKQRVLDDNNLDPSIRLAYRRRINELVANNRILVAVGNGDARRFNAYNHFIYGAPNANVFRASVDHFHNLAEKTLFHPNYAVRSAAAAVLHYLPDVPGDRSILAPSPELFAAVRKQHFKEDGVFPLLFAGVTMPTEGKITKEVGDPVLRQVLNNVGAPHYSIEDAQGSSWSMSHLREVALRPPAYNLVTERFMGLAAGHEIGSHTLERMNGWRQPVRLLGEGLDRYEIGNEGRAVMREQIVYPTFEEFAKTQRWNDILRRNLAVGAAMGVDQASRMRSFTQMYPIINAIDRLRETIKHPNDPITVRINANKKTEDLLADRIMRGTYGFGAYLKDGLYLTGNVACWGTAAHDLDIIAAGDLGKHDITNSRHIALLGEWGIIKANG